MVTKMWVFCEKVAPYCLYKFGQVPLGAFSNVKNLTAM